MRVALTIDFGSTYTKLRAIDLDKAKIIGSGQGPSTVATDINHGLDLALEDLEKHLGVLPDFECRLASSSAAGGLRMVTIGLVPKLTSQAARHAALGAGAKILANYSYELTEADVSEIDDIAPDILLLSGGTDGGNKTAYLANAETLSRSRVPCPIILAGNRSASDQAEKVLGATGKTTVTTENVMPEYLKLNIEPAREAIRGLFIDHIINAKGIDRAANRFDEILMPTPAAVLEAASLLADGTSETAGIGPLIVLDIGGATTDVHSICNGAPAESSVIMMGLQEPYAMRTVEGDLGMRHTAKDVVDAVGISGFANLAKVSAASVKKILRRCQDDVDWLPETTVERAFDAALARLAVSISVERHAGEQRIVQTVQGPMTVQSGKDLTEIKTVIGTGGILVHGANPLSALSRSERSAGKPGALCPRASNYFLDSNYMLYACGLLRGQEPETALKMAKQSLKQLNTGLHHGVSTG